MTVNEFAEYLTEKACILLCEKKKLNFWVDLEYLKDVMEKTSEFIRDIHTPVIPMMYDWTSHMARMDFSVIDFTQFGTTNEEFHTLLQSYDEKTHLLYHVQISDKQREWLERNETGCEKFRCSMFDHEKCRIYGNATCSSGCTYNNRKCENCMYQKKCGMTVADFNRLSSRIGGQS